MINFDGNKKILEKIIQRCRRHHRIDLRADLRVDLRVQMHQVIISPFFLINFTKFEFDTLRFFSTLIFLFLKLNREFLCNIFNGIFRLFVGLKMFKSILRNSNLTLAYFSTLILFIKLNREFFCKIFNRIFLLFVGLKVENVQIRTFRQFRKFRNFHFVVSRYYVCFESKDLQIILKLIPI